MKKKVLRNLGIVSLVLTCVALSPKTVNAAKITNDSFEKAKEIKVGQKMDVTCEDDNEKYKDRYYKFKISNENTWTDFQMTNYAGEMEMQIYDSDRTLVSKTGRIWTGNIEKMHVASENSGHVEDRGAILLAPEETYYFVIQPNYWASGRVQNYHFEVNSTKDDNWGMRENAKELAMNKKVKGNLEFKDDIDSFCVKLPKDNQKHIFYISANKGADVSFRNSNDSELGQVTIEKNRINSEFSCKGKGQKVYKYETNPDAIIFCGNGSGAQEYAEKNNIHYELTLPCAVHDWGEGKITQKATCSKKGRETYTCKICGADQTKEIPMLSAHKISKWKVTKSPTVMKAGQKAGKCSICGQTIRQSIKKIPATISVKKSITLKVKKSTTIKVKYQKGDGIKSWISNNKKIVTVSKSGKVIGKKKGKAVLTVKLKSGKTAKVKVTVK